MYNECFTVLELNNFIRDVLESGFPQSVWVSGEIQGFDRSKDKKHIFFELCAKDPETHEMTARIGLVIFAQTKARLDAILKKTENAFVLKDDIEVKFLCKVDFYPGHGQVRLIVESIDPVYTLGKIAQGRLRLIASLKQKGVLDKNKGLSLPHVALNIGLITSFDSAAYHDFISELKHSGYGFRVFMMNATMQGKNTEDSVIKALNALQSIEELDVIVVTRGGGSIAELSCFDSERIAVAVAESRLPVLSAIGHEINTTIIDLAAHTFYKTPTAVAGFLVECVQDFLRGIDEQRQRLIQAASLLVVQRQTKLKEAAMQLSSHTQGLIKNHYQYLAGVSSSLKRLKEMRIKESKKTLDETQINLNKIIYLHLQNSKAKINQFYKMVELASPENTLRRGFSITRSAQGRLLRRIKDVKGLKDITTQLSDGNIESMIKY